MRSTTFFSLLMACLLVSSLVLHSEGRDLRKLRLPSVKVKVTVELGFRRGGPCQVITEDMTQHVEARIKCPQLNVTASGDTESLAMEKASEDFVNQALQRNLIDMKDIEYMVKNKEE